MGRDFQKYGSTLGQPGISAQYQKLNRLGCMFLWDCHEIPIETWQNLLRIKGWYEHFISWSRMVFHMNSEQTSCHVYKDNLFREQIHPTFTYILMVDSSL